MDQDDAALVREHYDRLRRAAYVLTGSVEAADDLVQTALVKALRHGDRVHAAADPRGYLHVLLVHTHRSMRLRRWHGERAAGLDLPAQAGADEAARIDVRVPLTAALARLTVGQRRVLVLRFVADLSERETAAALHVAPGTVKNRTARALDVLRADPTLAGLVGPDPADESAAPPPPDHPGAPRSSGCAIAARDTGVSTQQTRIDPARSPGRPPAEPAPTLEHP